MFTFLQHHHTKTILGWIDTVSVRTLVGVATGLVVGFALLFWALTATGKGLHTTTSGDLNFGDCLYFSVVTFTSLGYGDITPISWARLFASAEVILGLAFLGVVIAKLSSARQNYYLG